MKLETAIAIAVTVATEGMDALPPETKLHDVRHAQGILRHMAIDAINERTKARETRMEQSNVRERTKAGAGA